MQYSFLYQPCHDIFLQNFFSIVCPKPLNILCIVTRRCKFSIRVFRSVSSSVIVLLIATQAPSFDFKKRPRDTTLLYSYSGIKYFLPVSEIGLIGPTISALTSSSSSVAFLNSIFADGR